jgi:hypothetical protein
MILSPIKLTITKDGYTQKKWYRGGGFVKSGSYCQGYSYREYAIYLKIFYHYIRLEIRIPKHLKVKWHQ